LPQPFWSAAVARHLSSVLHPYLGCKLVEGHHLFPKNTVSEL